MNYNKIRIIIGYKDKKKFNLVKVEIEYFDAIYKTMYFISNFDNFYTIFYLYFQ